VRGPGSAVYGNVALTCVINVITKDASKIDGATIQLSGGSNSTVQGNFTFGKKFSDKYKLVLYGQYYQSSGEKVNIPVEDNYSVDSVNDQSIYISRFDNPGTYDLGLKFNAGNFQLLAQRQQTHYTEPFTAQGAYGPNAQVYDYSKYRTFQGYEPGQSNMGNHLELRHARGWLPDKSDRTLQLSSDISLYYDNNELLLTGVSDSTNGAHRMINTQDWDAGVLGFFTLDYKIPHLGKGSFLLGGQGERMELEDAIRIDGRNYSWNTVWYNNAG
jgi:outer membrane receptor for ferrienterochelin and colicins